jgi:hypothetical protein
VAVDARSASGTTMEIKRKFLVIPLFYLDRMRRRRVPFSPSGRNETSSALHFVYQHRWKPDCGKHAERSAILPRFTVSSANPSNSRRRYSFTASRKSHGLFFVMRLSRTLAYFD